VTTPQDVALSDVRKSINFCHSVNLEILGLIENMGPFKCPCCSETIELFKSGGGKRTAETMGIRFLGTVPFDPNVVKACDSGRPAAGEEDSGDFSRALGQCVNTIIELLK
jgi:ATP-binding protein involved in chromosome partitioning